ncbi:MAG: beta-ketoacyl-[acyl-carrier-protein] synthase family protein, partial [Spirochaetes bacterium]|nr:beta-ketoacyl-[acyl-carrier-protein] synthase family protein [Spirochaetota bacterium]
MSRVFITGINIISSLGLNLEENWQNLIKGKSGVQIIHRFDPQETQTKIAAQLPEQFDEFARNFIKKRHFSQMTRITRAGYVCAKELINQSQVNTDELDLTRCSVIMGIVNSGYNSTEPVDEKNRIIKAMSNALPAWISMEYHFQGPSYSVGCACSSSAFAICQGYDLIKYGKADLVIVGGADSIINQ